MIDFDSLGLSNWHQAGGSKCYSFLFLFRITIPPISDIVPAKGIRSKVCNDSSPENLDLFEAEATIRDAESL